MKTVFLTLFFGLSISYANCNREVIHQTAIKMDSLTQSQISLFFSNIDSTCANVSIELGQWLNQIFFDILCAHPREVLIELESIPNATRRYFLENMNHPFIEEKKYLNVKAKIEAFDDAVKYKSEVLKILSKLFDKQQKALYNKTKVN